MVDCEGVEPSGRFRTTDLQSVLAPYESNNPYLVGKARFELAKPEACEVPSRGFNHFPTYRYYLLFKKTKIADFSTCDLFYHYLQVDINHSQPNNNG